MKMNVKKTMTIVASRKVIIPKLNIILDGQPIEQETKFVYFGQLITENGRCNEGSSIED